MYYLAIDLGAGSGRGIVYSIKNGAIVAKEVHRFSGYDITESDGMRWDINMIFDNIILALEKSYASDLPVTSIGIDTWGVDYGIIEKNGDIPNPYHYRDKRTCGVIDQFASEICSSEDIYAASGIAPNEFNTLYQFYKGVKGHQFDNAKAVGFISNILGYMLTGELATEPTITSTSAFYHHSKGYNYELLDAIKFDAKLLPRVQPTNTILGRIKTEILTKLRISRPIDYVLIPAHDTAAAISAIPELDSSRLYLSAGTWSLFGTLLDDCINTPTALKAGYSNELGINNVRFLRNITGFWIIQQCLKQWCKTMPTLGYGDIGQTLKCLPPSQVLIDISDSIFVAPDNMLDAISSYLARTHQPKLNSIAEISNCIYTSLALEYRRALSGLSSITGKSYASLNIFGGGSQNETLCAYAASALNLKVFAGINEASSLGNAISQMIAAREVDSLASAHELVRRTYPIKTFLPNNTPIFDELYDKYIHLND